MEIRLRTTSSAALAEGSRVGIEGWVDLGGWLHAKMVYPPTNGHPSKY